MGDLLLCNGMAAAVPYYLEGIAVNIYSLEELCYYIAGSTELLEKNFMNSELVTWIGRDLGKCALSERLTQLLDDGGKLSAFVFEILKESGYCTPEENREIFRVLSEMEERTPFERSKLCADRLMERDRLLSSVYEYRSLLESEDYSDESALMQGDVWHNLGTAYVRIFLFDKALECYRNAYRLNERPESLKSLFYVYVCKGDELSLQNEAEEYHIDDVTLTAWRNEFALRNPGKKKEAFEQRLSGLEALSRAGKNQAYKEEAASILQEWKTEYRRNCGV